MGDDGGKAYYPFLLAAYPIVFLYANNMSYHVSLTEVASLAAASVAVTFAAFALLSRMLKDGRKAGLVVAAGLIFFFSYGHFYGLMVGYSGSIKYLPNMGHGFLLPVYAIMFAFMCFLLMSLKALVSAAAATRFLNYLSFFLVAAALMGIVSYGLNSEPAKVDDGADCLKMGGAAQAEEGYPDIYYIILDGYGRTDVLRERYGFDNSEFTGYLEGRGFYIPAKSRCNYCYTFLSLASSLNMEYINYLGKTVGEDSSDRWEIGRMTRNNKALCFLKSRGYRYVTFTNYFEADYRQEADLKVECSMTDFTRIVFTTTVLRALDVKEKRDDELCILRELPEVRRKIKGPRFVFAHLQAPHPPYVLDDGYWGAKGMPYDASEKKRAVENYRILNGRLEGIIDRLTLESDRPVLIILQSDHGPPFATYEPNMTLHDMLNYETKNFIAVRLPGGDANETLYDTITPVNIFRLAFNRVFNTTYERLDDRVYFSEYARPYRFIDITDAFNDSRLASMEADTSTRATGG